jgi:hypothetical protein
MDATDASDARKRQSGQPSTSAPGGVCVCACVCVCVFVFVNKWGWEWVGWVCVYVDVDVGDTLGEVVDSVQMPSGQGI